MRDDFSPVEGAQVTARNTNSMKVFAPEATDSRGRFELRHLPEGKYQLFAKSPRLQQAGPAVIVDTNTDKIPDSTIVMNRGVTLAGRIVNATQADFDLINVQIQAVTLYRETKVQYDGSFEFDALVPGDYLIMGWIGNTGRSANTRVTISPGDAGATCRLDFGSGVSLHGRIFAGQAPIGTGMVNMRGENVSHYSWTRIFDEGQFEFNGLPVGRYHLEYTDPDAGLSYDQTVNLETSSAIDVHVPIGRIVGTARASETDQPVSGVHLTATRSDTDSASRPLSSIRAAESRQDGSFEFNGISPGTWKIGYDRDGYAPGVVVAQVPEGEAPVPVTIALAAEEQLSLQVVAADGRRLDAVRVGVFDDQDRVVTAETLNLDDSAIARVAGLPRGDFQVLVQAPGTAVTAVHVSVPGPSVAITLLPSCTLTVSVSERDGLDLPLTATVRAAGGNGFLAFSPSGTQIRRAWPMPGRVVTIEGLPPGRYRVEIRRQDGEVMLGDADVQAGARNELVVGS